MNFNYWSPWGHSGHIDDGVAAISGSVDMGTGGARDWTYGTAISGQPSLLAYQGNFKLRHERKINEN